MFLVASFLKVRVNYSKTLKKGSTLPKWIKLTSHHQNNHIIVFSDPKIVRKVEFEVVLYLFFTLAVEAILDFGLG